MASKYPLFMSPLMQEGSFCFVAPTYEHPFKDEWRVGAVGWGLEALLQEQDNMHIILGIEKKRLENDWYYEHQIMMHDNGFVDMDNVIETPDLYYEKTLDCPIKYLSKHLDKYCIVRDKNISKFIKIVNRTPTGIYYKNLQESEYIEKIAFKDPKTKNLSKKGMIEVIKTTTDGFYYLTYTPIGRIHKAPYKKYYADMIKEILKYDEEKQKEQSLTLSLQ